MGTIQISDLNKQLFLLKCSEETIFRYLGLHIHEVQPLGVHANVDTEHFVVAGAGLGVDLAREEGRSVSGNVPAVLQEESLQVVHLFTDPLAGAQGLSERGSRDRQPVGLNNEMTFFP